MQRKGKAKKHEYHTAFGEELFLKIKILNLSLHTLQYRSLACAGLPHANVLS